MRSAFLAIAALLAVARAAPTQNIAALIAGNPELSTLNTWLTQAQLTGTLASQSPLTVFAPSNEAFANFPFYLRNYFLASENAALLQGLLEYHVTHSLVNVNNIVPNQKIVSLQGSAFFVEYITGTTNLGLVSATCDKDVAFVGQELAATNGFLQVIDKIMMPPALVCPDELFWVEQRGAGRVGFDGYNCRAKGSTTLRQNEEKPVGLAIDSNQKVMFWSNDQNAKPFDSWLSKINYDGTGYSQFVTNAYDPQGMDTDTTNQKLYFTEHQGNDVKRCNYDGSAIELVYQGRQTTDFPADVVVDPASNVMFITVQSIPELLNGTLVQAAMDGSNPQILYSGLIQNYGLCIDRFAKHVYYIQGGKGGSISCHAYGTTPCNTTNHANGIVIDDLQYPYMCDVDNVMAPYGGPTQIVFSEPNIPGSIYQINNDGSGIQLIGSDLDAPMGVKLGCRIFTA